MSKKEKIKLLENAADTGDDIIKHARKKNGWVKWCIMALCLCIVVGGILELTLSKPKDDTKDDTIIYKYRERWFALKNVETELGIPEFWDIPEGQELCVCNLCNYTDMVTIEEEKANFEEFAAHLEFDAEPVIMDDTGEYLVQYLTDSGTEVVIESDVSRITITLPRSGAILSANQDAVMRFFSKNPFVKAMLAYKGITEPDILRELDYDFDDYDGTVYRTSYPNATYRISQTGLEGFEKFANTVTIYRSSLNDLSIQCFTDDSFYDMTMYETLDYDTVIDAFCEECGFDRDDIYKVGFDYSHAISDGYIDDYKGSGISMGWNTLIPCYVVVIKGDNASVEHLYAKPFELQVWNVFSVPAIDHPIDHRLIKDHQ